MTLPTLRQPARFGILRMLVALCPGFGAAVAAVAMMRMFGVKDTPTPFYVAMAAITLVLAVAFGWLDAMLNPSLPKIEGSIRTSVLVKSIAIFVLVQMLVAPVMFAGSLMMLGIAGFRL